MATGPADAGPDRDEHLGGVEALATILRVIDESIGSGVALSASSPQAEGDETWTEQAALLSLLTVTQWHGQALVQLARTATPLPAVAQLRPLVEAWLRIEAVVHAQDIGGNGAVQAASERSSREAWLAHVREPEWRDDLLAAWEACTDALPHQLRMLRAADGRVTAAPAEVAGAAINHLGLLASRVVARSWTLASAQLGLPIVPEAVWSSWHSGVRS